MNEILNPEKLEQIYLACSYRNGVITEDSKVVDSGLFAPTMSHNQLEVHRVEIEAMLAELPEEFKEGWSLVCGYNDKHGHQWTGLQAKVLMLFILGMGIGKVVLTFPKERFRDLPGGMPYYTILE